MSLKKQIKEVELRIQAERTFLDLNYQEVKHYLISPKVFPFALFGSVSLGYLLMRKKGNFKKYALLTTSTLPNIIKRLKFLLPLII